MAKKVRVPVLVIATIALVLGFMVCADAPAPMDKSKAESGVYKLETKMKKAYQVINDGMYVLEGVVRIEDGQVADCDIEEINTMLVWG